MWQETLPGACDATSPEACSRYLDEEGSGSLAGRYVKEKAMVPAARSPSMTMIRSSSGTVASWRHTEYLGAMDSDEEFMAPATSTVKQLVLRLLNEFPEERLLLRAACEQARKCEPGDFAGSWVLRELQQLSGRSGPVLTGDPAWRPGLRRLSAYGLIEKTDTSRGGRRAYYRMPDREAVEQALAEIEAKFRTATNRQGGALQ